MYRGDTLEFPLAVKTATGTPYDLTNATLWCTVKRAYAEPDILALAQVTSTAQAGIFIAFPPTLGKAQVVLPSSMTIDMGDAAVNLVYDVQVKGSDGAVFTIEAGTITVYPDVTRRTS
jgi:hypothetical protein